MGLRILEESPTIEDTANIVAPYAADIDTEVSGTVYYTDHPIRSGFQLDHVSRFVESQKNESFSGTKMVVVHWQNVSLHLGDLVSRRAISWQHFPLLYNPLSVCILCLLFLFNWNNVPVFYLRIEQAISKAF